MPVSDKTIAFASGSRQDVVQKTVTSAQVLALNATPQTLVVAPGAGRALIFLGAVVHKPAGTAYAGIAATEELAVKYTNGSGLNVGTCEATGFLDQSTAQTRWIYPHAKTITVDTPDDITPVVNAAFVAHMVVGEVTTGTSSVIFRVYFRVIPFALV